MKFVKTYWDKIAVVLFILIYIVTFSTLSILRHDAFASGYDLGNMDQTIWSTLHGHIFSLTLDGKIVSRFAIHADLILALLAPLYAIWNNVRMLLIFQSVALALGAIPLYLLSMKILGNKCISLSIVIVYFLNPGLEWTNIYDFHGISLVIPFLISAFYFAYSKNWRWYWVFLILSIICKEEVALSLAMLGLLLFFVSKERIIGLITFFGCVAWFSLIFFVVLPHFSIHHRFWALQFYDTVQEGLQHDQAMDVPKEVFVNYIINPDDIHYYGLLLKPYAFLAALGFPWTILSLPELMINLLSDHAQMRSITLHYDSGIIPGLVIGLVFAFRYLQWILAHIKKLKKYTTPLLLFICIGILAVAVRFNYHYSPLPTTPSCWCVAYKVSDDDRTFDEALQKIPTDAIVSASPEVRPHVTHRLYSYTLPKATDSANFIAIIDQNRLPGDYGTKDYETQLIHQLRDDDRFTLVTQAGHFYLYKRN